MPIIHIITLAPNPHVPGHIQAGWTAHIASTPQSEQEKLQDAAADAMAAAAMDAISKHPKCSGFTFLRPQPDKETHRPT
jgi:hypothetical protein